jgi:hypothetical protein
MTGMPPEYKSAPGKEAFARRLRSLLCAGVEVGCRVYAGLAAPSARSPLHAQVTFTIAKYLADKRAEDLPTFNTSPPPVLRGHCRTVRSTEDGGLAARATHP